MNILKLSKKVQNSSLDKVILALESGKTVVYPTDTSYGIAVDAVNSAAVERLYMTKGRDFKKPVHIVVSSRAMAKKFVVWNATAEKLAKAFWPGPLTIVSKLKTQSPVIARRLGDEAIPARNQGKRSPRSQGLTRDDGWAELMVGMQILTSGTGYLGVRIPNHKIPLSIVKKLGKPITATSSNVSNQPDCYSAEDIIKQFKERKLQPDILIDMGQLPRRKPSTVVRVEGDIITILRKGPISKKYIEEVLK